MFSNAAYALTKPGILKMATVAFSGIFIFIPLVYGMHASHYFKYAECQIFYVKDGYCANVWPLRISAAITLLEFFTILIVFIVVLNIPLNEKPKFKIIDIVGHGAGGVVCILTAGLMFQYIKEASETQPACSCPSCQNSRPDYYDRTFTAAGVFMVFDAILFVATAVIIGMYETPKAETDPEAPATPNEKAKP